METYKHSQYESEILRLLAHSEKEIEAGKGYDLEVVLAEADSVLNLRKNPMRHKGPKQYPR